MYESSQILILASFHWSKSVKYNNNKIKIKIKNKLIDENEEKKDINELSKVQLPPHKNINNKKRYTIIKKI